jgi:hypothetical protein
MNRCCKVLLADPKAHAEVGKAPGLPDISRCADGGPFPLRALQAQSLALHLDHHVVEYCVADVQCLMSDGLGPQHLPCLQVCDLLLPIGKGKPDPRRVLNVDNVRAWVVVHGRLLPRLQADFHYANGVILEEQSMDLLCCHEYIGNAHHALSLVTMKVHHVREDEAPVRTVPVGP